MLGHELGDVVFGEAETAAEALAQINAHPWQLVILDVSLPDDDDGFSVLREVYARHPQAAVLALGVCTRIQSTPAVPCNSVPRVMFQRTPAVPICRRRSEMSSMAKSTLVNRFAGKLAARDSLLSKQAILWLVPFGLWMIASDAYLFFNTPAGFESRNAHHPHISITRRAPSGLPQE